MSLLCLRPVSVQIVLLAIALTIPVGMQAEPAINEAAKVLPADVDSFKAEGPAAVPIEGSYIEIAGTGEFGPVSAATRGYRDEAGTGVTIQVVRTENDAAAYALLTRMSSGTTEVKAGVVGVAGIVSSHHILFCKGNILGEVLWSRTPGPQERLLSFSQAFAATLPNGDDQIPVLVMHLPNWQTNVGRAAYAVTLLGLRSVVPNQSVLDALDFEGGTEAVTATYGQSQLVIVEFTTPQFAGDNDRRIVAKIQELRNQGQPAPTAYRRVGNYSVFVFNAPDEKTANQLIDQVKYQQVVQWLGDDPHLFERLQRYYAETSANVLVAVLKSSGLSLIFCLGIGALIGTLLFRHRRAQRATRYSDAGGTVRLNLDELTGTLDSRKLLGSRSPGESNPDQN